MSINCFHCQGISITSYNFQLYPNINLYCQNESNQLFFVLPKGIMKIIVYKSIVMSDNKIYFYF